MKTAMQELIERLDKTEKQLDKENNLIMSSALYAAKSMALEYLEKEKEDIMNAVGLKKSTKKDTFGNNRIITLTPEEYYNQTYNQNK